MVSDQSACKKADLYCRLNSDFPRLILRLYHQLLHGAELGHIYSKDRLRRHIVFTDQVLQKVLCLIHDTAQQHHRQRVEPRLLTKIFIRMNLPLL